MFYTSEAPLLPFDIPLSDTIFPPFFLSPRFVILEALEFRRPTFSHFHINGHQTDLDNGRHYEISTNLI